MRCNRAGFQLEARAGGFSQLAPRLVTLDLSMPDTPDFSAFELFTKIHAESPEAAVIVISVHPRYANASRFLALGAVAYLEKAFMDFKLLRSRLEHRFPELAPQKPAQETTSTRLTDRLRRS